MKKIFCFCLPVFLCALNADKYEKNIEDANTIQKMDPDELFNDIYYRIENNHVDYVIYLDRPSQNHVSSGASTVCPDEYEPALSETESVSGYESEPDESQGD